MFMNNRYSIVFVLASIFLPNQLNALMSYDHRHNAEGKSVVIFEDFPGLDTPTKSLFEGVLRMIQDSPHARPLTFLIPSRPTDMPNQRRLASKNVASVVALASLPDSKVRDAHYVSRSNDSVMMHHLLDSLRQAILVGVSVSDICKHYAVPVPRAGEQTATVSGESWESFRIKLKKDEIGIRMNGVTIGSYIKSLDRDLEKLTALAKKHQGNQQLFELFQQEIATYTSACNQIKIFMGGPETECAATPLTKFFSESSTVSERLIAHDFCKKLFIDDTESIVSFCTCLDKLFTVFEKEPCACLITPEELSHKLSLKLGQLGFSRLCYESIGVRACPFVWTNHPKFEFGLKLFGVVSSLLGQLQKITSRSCHGCLKDFDGDVLKLCGRCKEVRYCSIECQRMDWAVHKTACKEKVKIPS
jgi:hypothetical protein